LVDTVRVWPVGLNSDHIEALVCNQALSYLRAQAVELMGSVGGFSEQNETRVPAISSKGSKSVVSPVRG
jgi:hypothetical protein